MSARDYDRPGCGARSVAGFPGSRRLHGVPRKCVGRGYQRPGWGRSCGTERTRRGGNRWNRGGAQSHRLWDGGGNQSRKVGRSRRLSSSGGDRSREVGPSPWLLCSRSGISRGKGRSRLLGREPSEEGGLDTLGLREGRVLGLFLGFERSNACLTLHVGPCHFFDGRGDSWSPWHSVV